LAHHSSSACWFARSEDPDHAHRARLHGLACFAVVAFVAGGKADDPKTSPVAKAAPPAGKLAKLVVYPSKIVLTGPRDDQRLGVLGIYADGQVWDHSRDAVYSSSAPKTAIVTPGGLVQAAGDGQAVISVDVAGQKAIVAVSVKKASLDMPVSFTQEVQPILTRLGCNQGACHGSQHGKGGSS
jgi:hypothetical protein